MSERPLHSTSEASSAGKVDGPTGWVPDPPASDAYAASLPFARFADTPAYRSGRGDEDDWLSM